MDDAAHQRKSALVASLAHRMRLRAPQKRALEILAELAPSAVSDRSADGPGRDPGLVLSAMSARFPALTDFERAFPSLCFELAPAIGKTRLMGAFIAFLHLSAGLRHFMVLSPGLTVQNKLAADFTPGSAKYVFKGLTEFVLSPPRVVTGDNFALDAGSDDTATIEINLFNIAKLNGEVVGRGPRRLRTFREDLGQSYFERLASLPNLVLLMDEAHRYRAAAGLRVLDDLRPALGLELTATAFTESRNTPAAFRNIVYSYGLTEAIGDGWVKDPAVVTRADFHAADHMPAEIEAIKLEDGSRLHEEVAGELAAYALRTGERCVKPVMLVVARDTAHAAALKRFLESADFRGGRFAGKVIQVDTSREDDSAIERLLRVESPNEPTEIVIHVDMLKEGWDVDNIFTIVPLRAARARTLIVQSIGRGLRLPFGRHTGVTAIDRLNIVAHDRFEELLRAGATETSPIRLGEVVLGSGERESLRTVVVYPHVASLGGGGGGALPANGGFAEAQAPYAAQGAAIDARIFAAIRAFQTRPLEVPATTRLGDADIRADLVRMLDDGSGTGISALDLDHAVDGMVAAFLARTIDVPSIRMTPSAMGLPLFRDFEVDLTEIASLGTDDMLWIGHLRNGERERIFPAGDALLDNPGEGAGDPADVLVDALIGFEDIAYEEDTELLFRLTRQILRGLEAMLGEGKTLRLIAGQAAAIAGLLRRQMYEHADIRPGHGDAEATVLRGFTDLLPVSYAMQPGGPRDLAMPMPVLGARVGLVYGGLRRCLYPLQTFDSEPERTLAVLLDRDAIKWFRPATRQLGLVYRLGADVFAYRPDFIVETADTRLIIEIKAADRLADPAVGAKREAAVAWCRHATRHADSCGAKPWLYLLIPHDRVSETATLGGLIARFGVHGRP